jgi:hypothetical protein
MPSLVNVGSVAVDSGLLHLGDPLYIGEHPYDDWEEMATAAGRMKHGALTLHPDYVGMVITNFGEMGDYPVYVEQADDGKVLRLVIDFQGEKK